MQLYLVTKAHKTVGCWLKEHCAAEWHTMEAVEEGDIRYYRKTGDRGDRMEKDFVNQLPQFSGWLLEHSFALGQRLHLFPKRVKGIVQLGS